MPVGCLKTGSEHLSTTAGRRIIQVIRPLGSSGHQLRHSLRRCGCPQQVQRHWHLRRQAWFLHRCGWCLQRQTWCLQRHHWCLQEREASRYSTFSGDRRSRPSPAFRVGSRCILSMCRSYETCGKRGGVDISTEPCRRACCCWRRAEGAARYCAKSTQEEVQCGWPGRLERPAVPQGPGTQV
jgi:hypothetical protein